MALAGLALAGLAPPTDATSSTTALAGFTAPANSPTLADLTAADDFSGFTAGAFSGFAVTPSLRAFAASAGCADLTAFAGFAAFSFAAFSGGTGPPVFDDDFDFPDEAVGCAEGESALASLAPVLAEVDAAFFPDADWAEAPFPVSAVVAVSGWGLALTGGRSAGALFDFMINGKTRGRDLIEIALRNPLIGVDPAVAKKRPAMALRFDQCWIDVGDEDLVAVRRRLRDDLS